VASLKAHPSPWRLEDLPDSLRRYLSTRLHKLRVSHDQIYEELQYRGHGSRVWRPIGAPLSSTLRHEVLAQPLLLAEWKDERGDASLVGVLQSLTEAGEACLLQTAMTPLTPPYRLALSAPDGLLQLSLRHRFFSLGEMARLPASRTASTLWPCPLAFWKPEPVAVEQRHASVMVVLGRAVHAFGWGGDWSQPLAEVVCSQEQWRDMVLPLSDLLRHDPSYPFVLEGVPRSPALGPVLCRVSIQGGPCSTTVLAEGEARGLRFVTQEESSASAGEEGPLALPPWTPPQADVREPADFFLDVLVAATLAYLMELEDTEEKASDGEKIEEGAAGWYTRRRRRRGGARARERGKEDTTGKGASTRRA